MNLRILRRLLASVAVVLALAGCSDDEQAPAPLPDKVQLNAPAQAEVGTTVKLSSTASTGTDGLRFDWDFGDGSRSDQPQPSHSYAAAGHYEVKLTLRNSDGQSRTATTQVVAGHFARLQGLECNQPDQTGWCWQQPRPRGNAVHDAYFANAQRGWVVGEAGLILRTDDGGANWTAQRSGVEVSLWQVRFSDAQRGYAVGDNATLLRTDDGGGSWSKIHVDAVDGLSIRRVFLVDERTLVLTGAETHVAGYYDWVLTLRDHRSLQSGTLPLNELQVTATGGVIALANNAVRRLDADGWLREVLQAPAGQQINTIGSETTGRLWALSFLVPKSPVDDIYFGIPEREPDPAQSLTLHLSNDYGTTWQTKPVRLPAEAGGVLMYTLRIFNGGAGWAWSGSGKLLHSIDGGQSWAVVDLPWQPPFWVSAWSTGGWFIDPQTVQIYADGKLWLSVDGARHWQAMTPLFDQLIGVQPITRDGGGGLIRNGFDPGGMRRSVDNGMTWNPLGTGLPAVYYERLETLWFASDAKRGLVQSSARPLQETSDGGLHWQLNRPDLTCEYCGHQLHRMRDGTLWLDDPSGLSRSTDGGRTWTPLALTPQLVARYYFSFTSDKVLSAQTPTGVYRSTDGGQRWELLPVVIPDNVRRVTFADAQIGTLISNQGNLWRTGDGGQHWQRVPTESLLVRDGRIHFLDNRTGWIFGTQGEVLVTRDGGMSWQNVDLPPHGQMHDLRFVDVLHGWMVGEQGLIFATVDGGKTWVSQRSGTEHALWSVWAIDADTVWVSGDGGTLLTSSSGGR